MTCHGLVNLLSSAHHWQPAMLSSAYRTSSMAFGRGLVQVQQAICRLLVLYGSSLKDCA